MATWQAEVEAYVGSLTSFTTEASKWLNHSALKHLPIVRIDDPELAPTRVVDGGSGVTIGNGVRCLYGDKSGYRAPLVSQGDWGKYADSASLNFATAISPVVVLKDDFKVYLLPGGGSIYTIDASSYTNITSNNTGLWGSSSLARLVILDVAIRCLTFWMMVINSASLTTPYNALDTRLNTEEDIEIAGAKLQEIATRLNEHGVSVGTCKEKIAILAQMYSAELSVYTGVPSIHSNKGVA